VRPSSGAGGGLVHLPADEALSYGLNRAPPGTVLAVVRIRPCLVMRIVCSNPRDTRPSRAYGPSIGRVQQGVARTQIDHRFDGEAHTGRCGRGRPSVDSAEWKAPGGISTMPWPTYPARRETSCRASAGARRYPPHVPGQMARYQVQQRTPLGSPTVVRPRRSERLGLIAQPAIDNRGAVNVDMSPFNL
jgi:hypothetical protein